MLYGKGQNVASSKAYPQLPRLHQTPHTQVALPQNPSQYLPMVSLVLAEVEAL
jgi:hypothetical protein